MNASDAINLLLPLALALALAGPLGGYLARVYQGERTALDPALRPVEGALYRLARVDPNAPMRWTTYALALMSTQVLGLLALFALQLAQARLPLNPDGLGPVSWHSALNTAVSFVTNTNWQGYGGESTMSYLSQSLGLTAQNFLSAATGMAVAAALARGFARREREDLGNFWADLVRGTLWVLLPLSLVLALFLVGQGVVQTWSGALHVPLLDPSAGAEQIIARGPAAGQIAIKQLGTNGGGFFNANSAHPFENPTALSNLAECLAIVLLPAAFCGMFGRMVGDRRQGRALLLTMTILVLPALFATFWAEQASLWTMEGKEQRLGVAASAAWAVLTTAASNGSVNAMHDSLSALGLLGPLALIQLGEVVFGGVGSGLYGMVIFAIIAVFVAGLMVGRTPEYLGKKIRIFEVQMASLAVLAPSAAVLLGTALALSVEAGQRGVFNPGPRGLTEVLYAFSSAANNNGSALAGLGANTVFYNLSLGLCMAVGRYGVLLPTLAIAGSLARGKRTEASAGTLPTTGPLFIALLAGVVVLVGALTFLPALALGPIAEHLSAGSR